MRTDVFRIVQEALTNIARHADASIAYVRLKPEKDGLLLEVGDNGKGMLMAKHGDDEITGLGMVGMRERARNHQGTISVDSQPNKGTSISVYFPTITLD
jgi:signal transduction histidine kinase